MFMLYEKMSKAELIRQLKSIQATSGSAPTINGTQRYESRLSQIAQEAQNPNQQENEERFRRLLETMPMGAYICDADGLITYFNSNAAEVWGRAPKLNDAVDRYCGSFRLYATDGALITHDQCLVALAIKEDKVYEGREVVIERPDGSRLTALAHGYPIHDEGGKLLGAVNMVVDITERKRAEEVTARMAAIVESSDDAIISKDLNGIITSWNKGAEKIFGYTAAEVIGKPATILIPLDRMDEEPGILERIRKGELIDHYETVRRRKDGSEIDISLTVSPVRNKTGIVIGASKIARDITERKRAEVEREELLQKESAARAEAEATNRSKDEFLAMVSHELRAPMNAINGWVTLLREGGLDPDEVDKALAIIQRNTQAQTQLIDDLLDNARIVSGKLRLELSPLNINSVLADAMDVVRSAAEAKGVELRASYGSNSGVVAGDATRLRQIVWNLLSNGIKFTPDGGRVELRTERSKGHIRVIVSDTGEGIRPEFLPYVFDRFRQADSSTSKQRGGLGLGLALVKHLTELHGGKVQVESGGAGRGSTFTVTLPLATRDRLTVAESPALAANPDDEPQTEDASPLPAEFTIAGLRVLLVDDQEEARTSLATFLGRRGAIVKTVSSGSEALAMLSDPPDGAWPDIMICDIMMPGEDGYTVLRKLRALEAESGVATSKRIPAIALTSLAGNEDRMRTLSEGFQTHISKPADPIELMLIIANIAELWRERAAAN